MQSGDAGDPFEVNGDEELLPVVQRAGYEIRLNPSPVPGDPEADVLPVVVLSGVELDPPLEPNILAGDGDLAGEADELQLPNRSRYHCRPGHERAQDDHQH